MDTGARRVAGLLAGLVSAAPGPSGLRGDHPGGRRPSPVERCRYRCVMWRGHRARRTYDQSLPATTAGAIARCRREFEEAERLPPGPAQDRARLRAHLYVTADQLSPPRGYRRKGRR